MIYIQARIYKAALAKYLSILWWISCGALLQYRSYRSDELRGFPSPRIAASEVFEPLSRGNGFWFSISRSSPLHPFLKTFAVHTTFFQTGRLSLLQNKKASKADFCRILCSDHASVSRCWWKLPKCTVAARIIWIIDLHARILCCFVVRRVLLTVWIMIFQNFFPRMQSVYSSYERVIEIFQSFYFNDSYEYITWKRYFSVESEYYPISQILT